MAKPFAAPKLATVHPRPEPVSESNTQALLFVLLREFAFEQLPSKPRIEMKAAYVNFLFTLWLR